MVLGLFFNVFPDSIEQGSADGKNRIPVLPFKSRCLASFMDPVGRTALDVPDQVAQAVGRAKAGQDVAMILDSADGDGCGASSPWPSDRPGVL